MQRLMIILLLVFLTACSRAPVQATPPTQAVTSAATLEVISPTPPMENTVMPTEPAALTATEPVPMGGEAVADVPADVEPEDVTPEEYVIQDGALMRWDGSQYVMFATADGRLVVGETVEQSNLGLVVRQGEVVTALVDQVTGEVIETQNGLLNQADKWYAYSVSSGEWTQLPIEGKLESDQILRDGERVTILQWNNEHKDYLVPKLIIENESGRVVLMESIRESVYESGDDLYYYVVKLRQWVKASPRRSLEEYFQMTENNIQQWLNGEMQVDDRLRFKYNGAYLPLNIPPDEWPPPAKAGWDVHAVLLGFVPQNDKLAMRVGIVDQMGKPHTVTFIPIQEIEDNNELKFTVAIQSQLFRLGTSASKQFISLKGDRILRISEDFFGKPVLTLVYLFTPVVNGVGADYCNEAAAKASKQLGNDIFAGRESQWVDIEADKIDEVTLPCVAGFHIWLDEINAGN